MLKAISKIPSFYLFRMFGWPKKFPMNLTVSGDFRCNSRCLTCNVYEKRPVIFTLEEWTTFFKKFGKNNLFWITFSGGEPFMRPELGDVVNACYDHCRPAIINIPTNAFITKMVLKNVKKITEHCKDAQIVINVSLDEIGKEHDRIRGFPKNWEKAMETYAGLKELNAPNLTIGIHTVISRFNVKRIPQIYEELQKLEPDSYITEIAEERVELGTMGIDITPEANDYGAAVDFLIKQLKKRDFNQIGRITRAFRIEYYKLVKKFLREQEQMIPCYAGFSSAQITPDGDVWTCCTRGEPMGNLRDVDYDFAKIWYNDEANRLRKSIKNKECACPLANAAYTSMLQHPTTLTKVVTNLARLS